MGHGRKLVMSRASRIACRECGRSLRLSGREWLALAPCLVLAALTITGLTDADPYLVLGSGAAISLLLHLLWVPLVPADPAPSA